MSSSKAKKLSLPANDELFTYKSKDLIWAKMKGFTPWPGMVCDPPLEMLNQPRKANTKCIFFFGTRNFAWIEINNIKPFEGPWKDELAKVAKPSSFRHAMKDISAYIEDPTEIDAEIDRNAPPNHSSEADFDKIRDGLDETPEEELSLNESGVEPLSEGIDNGVEAGADEEVALATPSSSGGKQKTPKSKAASSAAKSAKSTTGKSTATKRRRSNALNATTSGSGGSKRKRRSTSISSNKSDYEPSAVGGQATSPRRKINTEALASIGSSMRRNVNTIALLNRPPINRPEVQAVDMETRSQTLQEREIVPSSLTFGFLGLGVMGSTLVKDLLVTGHKVVVWNRTMTKCELFRKAGAEVRDTPMDVVEAADIIFCCVSDPKASKDLVFGNCGVLQYKDLCNKAYVEMSTIDPETSQDIAEGIQSANGRYLEVQIHGTRQEAEDGMLIVLAGGDRSVFEDCESCFKTIAKNTFFLGVEVGNACKVNLILQTIVGVSLVGLAEALALADRFSISLKDILDIFELTSMKSPFMLAKGKEMAKGDFNPQQPLSHMQKDLRLVLSMAENLDQSMPVTAITNEVFKHTKRLGYMEHDSSAVFVRSRF